MRQRWEKVGFAHWGVDPVDVQRRLPDGLTVDVFDGAAWVSLVAFDMVGIGPTRGPAVPYFGTFPETNVRTYVRGPDGSAGVWFDSLDATRLLPVTVARLAYGLPYMWSAMSIVESGLSLEYRATRRFPDARGATSRLRLDRSGPAVESTDLDRFLTARWNLFTARGSRLWKAGVEHEPWPLIHPTLVALDDELVEAAGYRIGDRTPDVLHYSPGVSVRAGRPRLVAV